LLTDTWLSCDNNATPESLARGLQHFINADILLPNEQDFFWELQVKQLGRFGECT
jgi:hypothetical protein